MRHIDLVMLDEDPLSRQSMLDCLRLFHRDFPSGIRHDISADGVEPFSGGKVYTDDELGFCFVCYMTSQGGLTRQANGLVTISDELKNFCDGAVTDEDYINAVKAWVVFKEMCDETGTTGSS